MVDVLMLDNYPSEGTIICDIGTKKGRFDNALRYRITFRYTPAVVYSVPMGLLHFPEDTKTILTVEAIWKGGFWGQEFHRLDFTLDPNTDRTYIFLHQASNWYGFLFDAGHGADIHQTASMWASLPAVRDETDIVVLNRTASNALYDLARNLGWRKLTKRERDKLGLPVDAKQWQRTDYIAALTDRNGMSSGVGEHTLRCSHGKQSQHWCPQCEEVECQCQY